MKFEEFLMQPSEGQRRRLALEEEVEELQEKLKGEVRLSSVLRWAMKGPVLSSHCISSEIPFKAQVLLTELAMAEEEVIRLERKVRKTRLSANGERKLNNDLEMKLQSKRQMKQLVSEVHENGSKGRSYDLELKLTSPRCSRAKEKNPEARRRSFVGSASDAQSFSSTRFNEEVADTGFEKPNRISEELLRSLIRIFLKISKASREESEGASGGTRHSLSCISSRGFTTKTTFTCKARPSFNHENIQTVDPYKVSPDSDSISKDAAAYKGFIQITRSSLHKGYSSDCNTIMKKIRCIGGHHHVTQYIPLIAGFEEGWMATNHTPFPKDKEDVADENPGSKDADERPCDMPTLCNSSLNNKRIKVLQEKLCDVDLTFLTYKQKLAFWINIYNACIMNAYLQHGLPSTQERMLSLMNKAALNVGGLVLNVLAIEHYILRHPHDKKYDPADEKEMLLRHAYGLKYPQPNVTFALCRGNWSSPALRVYTPDDVVDELKRAKTEYLEASVGVRSRKKILVPKLLQWHMHDFADELESLIEWIYSQLPPNGLLKKRIMECLSGESNPTRNTVEITPYEYEFRYLIPTLGKGCT